MPPIYLWAPASYGEQEIELARAVGSFTIRANGTIADFAAAVGKSNNLPLVIQYSPLGTHDDLRKLCSYLCVLTKEDQRRAECVLFNSEVYDYRRLTGDPANLAEAETRLRYLLLTRLLPNARVAAYRYRTSHHWRGTECNEPVAVQRAVKSVRLYHSPDLNRLYLSAALADLGPGEKLSAWCSAPGGGAYIITQPGNRHVFAFAGQSQEHPQIEAVADWAAEMGAIVREHADRISEVCIYPHPLDARNAERGMKCFEAFFDALAGL